MSRRKKIAILGGGMGALSAAYWLTNQVDWQREYEVTVYQFGSRLGGKGATTRNPAKHLRIEEHGFHFFPGFYENAFHMMRECYAELGRGPDVPFSEFIAATPQDERAYPGRYAMLRQNIGQLHQWFTDWHLIEIFAPLNDGLPGDGQQFLSYRSYVESILGWLWEIYEDSLQWRPSVGDTSHTKSSWSPVWLDELITLPGYAADDFDFNSTAFHTSPGLYVSKQLARKLPENPLPRGSGRRAESYYSHDPVNEFLVARLQEHLCTLWNDVKSDIYTDYEAFRAWTSQDFAATNLIGILHDDVLAGGLEAINNIDYSDWLMEHATIPEGTQLTRSSPLVDFVYDAGFASLNNARNLEAGTAVRIGLRMFVDFRGSPFWMFQVGCADALFAPLYEVLDRRGVQFKFFQSVKKLHLDKKQACIAQIDIEEQAALKVDKYNPLIDVKGVPCWPEKVSFDQLVDGNLLRSLKIDLNSEWADYGKWRSHMTARTLVKGRDFDEVILGISLGALEPICEELIKASDAWAQMIQHIKTTCTQSIQVYLNKTAREVGWRSTQALMETALQPFSTWADMSQQSAWESWPADLNLRSIHYFVGAMPDYPNAREVADTIVRRHAEKFLHGEIKALWPRYQDNDLIDLYARGNTEPSSRYVLSVAASSQYRLAPAESGFANLFLAGDWVKTGLDYGCMEAAVMSGMQVARAITGFPFVVPGETDFGIGTLKPINPLQTIAASAADVNADLFGGIAQAIADALDDLDPDRPGTTLDIIQRLITSEMTLTAGLAGVVNEVFKDIGGQSLTGVLTEADYERLAGQAASEMINRQMRRLR